MLESPVILRSLLVLSALLTLASCGGRPALEPGTHLTVLDANTLPPPAGVDPNGPAQAYRIGAFDRLSISVFNVPELTQRVQVDASGRIALPLVGSIDALGKAPAQVATEIEGRLQGRYVREPQVAVNVEETVSHVVTVEGEVREPGLYPVMTGMTLLRAIASAKGTSELARLDDVVVFRTVGDQQMAALFNVRAIRRGLYPDPAIYANDVVVVGDSAARRMFRDILTAAPLITAPIIALLNSGAL